MSDGININKLTDSVKAFAQAADQNNDGVIDKKEVKLFNQFINATNQTQDEGLALERQAVAAADESTPKEKAKEARQIENEVEKSYKNYFGKDNIEAVKAMEGECNRRVINAFNNLKGAKSPDALNSFNTSGVDTFQMSFITSLPILTGVTSASSKTTVPRPQEGAM